ncbi:type III secretion protein [Pseudomonas sp. Leaf59]|uniref:type III secretion protein n=1 Tax=Pseudomonas sp. Leaf59 TaxID=2876556 RepID=UPI001E3B902E|nr:type III secretion protein [Pseudomonas sp. Leaf59]
MLRISPLAAGTIIFDSPRKSTPVDGLTFYFNYRDLNVMLMSSAYNNRLMMPPVGGETPAPISKMPEPVDHQPAASHGVNPLRPFSALSEIGQHLTAQEKDPELAALLKMYDALVGALNKWMAKDKTLPSPPPPMDVAPAPRTEPVSIDNVWRNRLAPFMERSNLAATRTHFDSELTEMFATEHYEPVTDFLSAVPKGQKPDDILNGLRASYEHYPYFGSAGREEHVGAIKVAMMKFGQSPASVCEDVVNAGDGYSITMRDGFKLTLSNEELNLAFRAAKFSGGDEGMVKDASFLFAVMSKRKSLELELYLQKQSDSFMSMYRTDSEYHACDSYPGVLALAGDGIDGYSALSLLGLKQQIKVVDAGTLGAQVGVPVTSGGRHKNGVIIDGVMEGQFYNRPVSPSLKVATLAD